jgi:hypothetical protein
MINKQSHFIELLLKYNLLRAVKVKYLIRYNYQFYTKPIATYLIFFFYCLISLGCVNIDGGGYYNTNAYLNNCSLGFIDKNFFKFIF